MTLHRHNGSDTAGAHRLSAENSLPTTNGSSLSRRRDKEVDFSVDKTGKGDRFVFSGELTVQSLSAVESQVRSAVHNAGGRVEIDLTAVTQLDTAGALLINLAGDGIRERGLECDILNGDEAQAKLLEKSHLERPDPDKKEKTYPLALTIPNNIGMMLFSQVELIGQLIGFMGQFLVMTAKLLLQPHRMRWTSLVFHMEQTGVRAVPIVSLLTFLIGMVVAYMGAEQLANFGAQVFAVKLLEVTVMREMAVLITAIVVAGRSSSSFTAQIGAMVANEEVAAMRSMGLDPNALLVVPRVLALMICLPMLVFVADISALLGGAAAIWYTIGMDLNTFVSELHSAAELKNFLVGLVKTPFFAMAIGLVGCFQGFRATSSAESVGFLTTVSVVQAIFIVILLDAVFAIFFTTIGI